MMGNRADGPSITSTGPGQGGEFSLSDVPRPEPQAVVNGVAATILAGVAIVAIQRWF